MATKRKVVKPSFTDQAKRKAGIEPSDFGKEVARRTAELDQKVHDLEIRIRSLEAAIDRTKVALLDNRRGDALKELARVRPAPQPRVPRDDGPRAA